jgi:hypothetical protein
MSTSFSPDLSVRIPSTSISRHSTINTVTGIRSSWPPSGPRCFQCVSRRNGHGRIDLCMSMVRACRNRSPSGEAVRSKSFADFCCPATARRHQFFRNDMEGCPARVLLARSLRILTTQHLESQDRFKVARLLFVLLFIFAVVLVAPECGVRRTSAPRMGIPTRLFMHDDSCDHCATPFAPVWQTASTESCL